MNKERGVLVSGNWKMNENHFEALRLVQELAALLARTELPEEVVLGVHPPFTSLRTVQTALETDHVPVRLGAQTCHFDDRGAFTGEVSAEMLAKLGVSYVIAGHSERRRYFGEDDTIVRKKIDAIWRNGMTALCCVGESAEERAGGDAIAVVRGQVAAAVRGAKADQLGALVIAYEPLWAIGTGVTATAADAQEMCAAIHTELVGVAGQRAGTVRVQYGGSVTPDNAEALLAEPDVDGVLVGGASLDATSFIAIARAAADGLAPRR